jgi:CheY-like chemotaxis protein
LNTDRKRPARILLVEDNEADVMLAEIAFKECEEPPELEVAPDGEAALKRLREDAGSAPAPDLVLLDLNMPGLDGKGVLRAIKGDDDLRRTPVVMLTSSRDPRDVHECYELGANAYLSKPADFSEFGAIARAVESFWLQRASLPGAE